METFEGLFVWRRLGAFYSIAWQCALSVIRQLSGMLRNEGACERPSLVGQENIRSTILVLKPNNPTGNVTI